jgi:putative colanic acid biosynthesis UDP-glucose lipid carrier transferase
MAISRKFLFTFIPPLFFLFLYSNDYFPPFLAKFVFSGKYVQNTILLGPPEAVVRLNDWLSRKSRYGVRMVGFVTDEPAPEAVDGFPCLGSSESLEKHIIDANATHVIAIGLLGNAKQVNEFADVCQRLGVRLLVANDYAGAFGRKVTLVEDDGIHFISFHREPLESPFNRALKRIMDLAIALPAVLLVLPVVSVIVWLLHRWQSPGPLFFRQIRTGMQDKEFMMYKFRTMQAHNPDEAQQAQKDDKRVFPAGRWLRKLSIDELPQFINVLKDEMSVVGPRPHLRAHDEIFRKVMNAYRVRAFIKPGITGLAQVRDHRGETKTEHDMIVRVESDLDYLENWSFLLDNLIVMRTIWKVICPPKASY